MRLPNSSCRVCSTTCREAVLVVGIAGIPAHSPDSLLSRCPGPRLYYNPPLQSTLHTLDRRSARCHSRIRQRKYTYAVRPARYLYAALVSERTAWPTHKNTKPKTPKTQSH